MSVERSLYVLLLTTRRKSQLVIEYSYHIRAELPAMWISRSMRGRIFPGQFSLGVFSPLRSKAHLYDSGKNPVYLTSD